MKTKQLSINDVQWSIECHPEDMAIRGNAMASGDDEYDREVESRISEQLESGNPWAWCIIVVKGRYKSLEASDCLGGCNYDSENDFRRGGYFEDMQSNILADLQAQLEVDASSSVE